MQQKTQDPLRELHVHLDLGHFREGGGSSWGESGLPTIAKNTAL